jgi:hypothetical protein
MKCVSGALQDHSCSLDTAMAAEIPSSAPVPYPSSHNSPNIQLLAERTFELRASGSVVALRSVSPVHRSHKGGGPRAAVSGFSRQSCQRFVIADASIWWSRIPESRLFDVEVPSRSPNRCTLTEKACREKLRKRMLSWFGPDGFSAMWKREYGSAGEWHVHVLLVVWRLPQSVAKACGVNRDSEIPDEFLGILRDWIARTWTTIVGGRDAPVGTVAPTYCTLVLDVRAASRYVTKGPASKHAKRHQAMLPDPDVPSGRWWGFWKRQLLPREPVLMGLTAKEYFDVKRMLRKVAQTRARGAWKPPIWSPFSGMSIISSGADGRLFEAITAYITSERVHNSHQLADTGLQSSLEALPEAS